MKTISIAMVTYNGARYVGEQMQSFASQTVLPNELVVVDNGSSDDTVATVKAFAAIAPFPMRIKSLGENLGYRAAFMKAASLCKGGLISFSDQDDVWLPRKLEACRTAFDNDEVLLAYHNARVVNDNLEPFDSLHKYAAPDALNPPSSLEPRFFALGFTQMFRRTLLRFDGLWPRSVDYNHPDEPEAHDQWYCFLASCLGTIAYIEEPLALYRRHTSNTTRFHDMPKIQRRVIVLLSNNIDTIRGREMSSAYRASVLKAVQSQLDGVYRARAVTAATGYRKLETSLRRRRQMYESSGISFRIKEIIALLRLGGYRPHNRWGSGRNALIRDIFRGILFPMRPVKCE